MRLVPPIWAVFLGRVADEGISVINFFAWLFQAPRAPRFDFLVTSVPAVGRSSSIANGKADIRDGILLLMAASLGNQRPITRAQWTAFYAAYNAILCKFTNAKPDYTVSSTAARLIGRIRHGLQSLHG